MVNDADYWLQQAWDLRREHGRVFDQALPHDAIARDGHVTVARIGECSWAAAYTDGTGKSLTILTPSQALEIHDTMWAHCLRVEFNIHIGPFNGRGTDSAIAIIKCVTPTEYYSQGRWRACTEIPFADEPDTFECFSHAIHTGCRIALGEGKEN